MGEFGLADIKRDIVLGLNSTIWKTPGNLPGKITVAKLVAIASLVVLASCGIAKNNKSGPLANINNKTKFSVSAYGVKGSPRVTTSKKVRKGGGRYQVGKPYKIKGKWYRPKEQPGYSKIGMASWYGPNFHGRLTANGEVYDQYSLSAAHPTLPLPSYAKVTNLANGSSVIVRINDRGPFSNKRIIDLSAQASKMLGYQKKGLAKVRVRYIGRARMDGLDGKYLMASYRPAKGQGIFPRLPTFVRGAKTPGAKKPGPTMPDATMPGTMIASIATPVPGGGLSRDIPNLDHIAYVQPSRSFTPIVAAGVVPVPVLRPTPLYEGLAMNLASNDNIVVSQLKPLSYLQGNQYNRRVAQAFLAIEASAGE